MDEPAPMDQNLLHEIHEALDGRLDADAREALAEAILAGRCADALSVLSAAGEAGPDAAAYVSALAALARTGRPGNAHLDGPGVREDLRVQPCQATVAELAADGHRAAAALFAVLHEGYAGAAARAAADILAVEMAGADVALDEIDPASAALAPEHDWEGPLHLARIGDAVVPGLFRAGAGGPWFEGRTGRRVPLRRVAQAWKVRPL